jgi:hypothetical protein
MEIANAEKHLAEANAALEAAQREEAKRNEPPDPLEWVKEGGRAWVNDVGNIRNDYIHNPHAVKALVRNLDAFPTREAAERELLLREARFTAFKPKEGERYLSVTFDKSLRPYRWQDDPIDWARYHCGNTARTESEMKERVKKYGSLWGVK